MMVQYGYYILLGLIAVLAIALAIFIGFMVKSSLDEKKVKQEQKEAPRKDTLADQIQKQFKVHDDERNHRRLLTDQGMTTVKKTRSIFAFNDSGDGDSGITLESSYESAAKTPFVKPDEEM